MGEGVTESAASCGPRGSRLFGLSYTLVKSDLRRFVSKFAAIAVNQNSREDWRLRLKAVKRVQLHRDVLQPLPSQQHSLRRLSDRVQETTLPTAW